jgi:hypothetical protein
VFVRGLAIAAFALFFSSAHGWNVARSEPVALANTETFSIVSDRVEDEYLIKVAYPRDYASSGKRYPVLYVTDAETNFGALQYVVQRLAKDKLIPELIVVGIAYDTSYDEFYRLRARDLRPSIPDDPDFDLGGRPDEGQAETFADFLRSELFPKIDETYRTVEGDRAYYGHSYGGLFGVWNLMYETDLFDSQPVLMVGGALVGTAKGQPRLSYPASAGRNRWHARNGCPCLRRLRRARTSDRRAPSRMGGCDPAVARSECCYARRDLRE